jgi:hypothetical protein
MNQKNMINLKAALFITWRFIPANLLVVPDGE